MKSNKHISADRNQQRRAKYATDPAAGNASREASRDKYHSQSGAPRPTPKLANGLLTRGQTREVIQGDMDHPVSVESFTIPEAAEALGRSVSTIRRWLEADRLPAPHLEDIANHYRVYSVGELEVIARLIASHEREFVYLVSENTHIVESLHQAIHAYRAQYV